MNVNVEMPITIYMLIIWEQYGCQTTEQLVKERTKHVHIRTVLVKEYQEEGKILIKSVNSEENDADINTKNTLNTTCKTNQAKIAWKKEEIMEKDS